MICEVGKIVPVEMYQTRNSIDRPWLGSDPPAVVYTYAPGRGAVHAAGLLQDFTGILQTDAYAAYKRVADRDGAGITIAYCWTHLRRQFYDVTKTAPAP